MPVARPRRSAQPRRGRCALLALATAFGMAAAARAETRYFQVAEPASAVHGDGYVLPLSDPADIAHAEELIRLGPSAAGAPIVIARIAAGADGVNRDYNHPARPAWSWHVVGFEGFADFTVEILDGWPTFVEADVPGWIANTGGRVGFWSYTVVADLTDQVIPEPAAAALLGPACLALLRRRRLRSARQQPPAPRSRRCASGLDQGDPR